MAELVAHPVLVHESPPQARPHAHASVASWLGILLVSLFALNTIGGWVRLSGSGVAIPQWPIVNGSLLPPMSEEGWHTVRAAYDADQQRLFQRVQTGALTRGNLGRLPEDLSDFKVMFLTEWSHRLVSALVGLMAIGCATVVWRRRELAHLIGVPMTLMLLLILVQAAIGGLLVEAGTSTHWLFLHQGIAATIMALVLVSLLRLVAIGSAPLDPAEQQRRRWLRVLATLGVVLAWMQVVAGGLVAGSRNGMSFKEWPVDAPVRLWEGRLGVLWNMQDNAWLHQWLHEWLAWSLVVVLLVYAAGVLLMRMPPRCTLAIKVALTFLAVQALLGVSNVHVGFTMAISLAHQFMGMCVVLILVLARFDVGREAPRPSEALPVDGVP